MRIYKRNVNNKRIIMVTLAATFLLSTGFTFAEKPNLQEDTSLISVVAENAIDISEFDIKDMKAGSAKIMESNISVNLAQIGPMGRSIVQGSASQSANDVIEIPIEEPKSEYADIAIAQVNNYVNIRSQSNTESEVLGKLYNNSAATVHGEEDGWYQITSGTVTGYVKKEYVVRNDEELARRVGTRLATVNTTTLFVRSEPTTDSSIIFMLPLGDDLVAKDESQDGWIMVSTEAGDGYISADYVEMRTDFIQAESKEEERIRLEKEEAERIAANKAAQEAVKKKSSKKTTNSSNKNQATSSESSSGSSGSGQAVVNYATQFLGNPYVYGGTSLTKGADCSGFVLSVYANFGISLPHSSAAQRNVGYAVSLENIQPGDIVCYSGHVGIYVGNNTIISASTKKTGIKYTSPVTYKNVLAVRRIF